MTASEWTIDPPREPSHDGDVGDVYWMYLPGVGSALVVISINSDETGHGLSVCHPMVAYRYMVDHDYPDRAVYDFLREMWIPWRRIPRSALWLRVPYPECPHDPAMLREESDS